MSTVDPSKLEDLIENAGISKRAANKMRQANQPDEDQAPRGHGAPSQNTAPFEGI